MTKMEKIIILATLVILSLVVSCKNFSKEQKQPVVTPTLNKVVKETSKEKAKLPEDLVIIDMYVPCYIFAFSKSKGSTYVEIPGFGKFKLLLAPDLKELEALKKKFNVTPKNKSKVPHRGPDKLTCELGN